MNQNQLNGKGHQLRGSVKTQWGKLPDDDLQQVEGTYDMLVEELQQRYGIAREDVDRRLNELDREGAAPGAHS